MPLSALAILLILLGWFLWLILQFRAEVRAENLKINKNLEEIHRIVMSIGANTTIIDKRDKR